MPSAEVSLKGDTSHTLHRLHNTLPGWRAREAARRALCYLPGMSRAPLVERHTFLTRARLKALEQNVRRVQAEGVPGIFVECGVGEGGSAALIGMHMTRDEDRSLVLFDTFEGLPAPTSDDPDFQKASVWTGKCKGTVDEVRALLNLYRVPLDRVTFVPGLFQDTLPQWRRQPIAFMHLDGDWYQSIATCLAELWESVHEGGIIQIDDYGIWKGCKRAVDEFLERHELTNALQHIDGAAVWLRKGSPA